MLDDGLPLLGPKIDLYQVEPIAPRRMLAFINFLISQTANFLNKFATTCEDKLDDIGMRIQRMETILTILETKIASVPGLENVVSESPRAEANVAKEASTVASSAIDVENVDSTKATTAGGDVADISNNVEKTENIENKLTNKNNPLYKKYFTMLSMGIPSPAIKQKMMMDNMDPNILDNPGGISDAPANEKGEESKDNSDDDSSNDSDSSFDD